MAEKAKYEIESAAETDYNNKSRVANIVEAKGAAIGEAADLYGM